MLSIESVMLLALGFLLATLVFLAIAPAYRRRAERLTTAAIRNAMPLTEAEIRADKDRLRAGFAIQIHNLEERIEKATQLAARQRVEINRRDGTIVGLEGEVKRFGAELEEQQNARRVLEQTIMDRLPRVEQRLAEAKKLLLQRDREISRLTASAEQQARALEEATQINSQNRDEIHRLQAALTTRAARNRDGIGDPRFDGEVALRSEIEALRSKTRDQEQMIARLQTLASRVSGGVAGRKAQTMSQGDASGRGGGALGVDQEIARLRGELAQAEASLRSAQNSPEDQDRVLRLETEIRKLKSSNEDQALEIKRLQAALNAYQESERKDTALRDSKMAMKSRIAALQSQTEGQAVTIQSLRAEIAAANERLARQASHYMDELRKLGAGRRGAVDREAMAERVRAAGPSSPPVQAAAVQTVAERPATPAKAPPPSIGHDRATRSSGRPSLSERIAEPPALTGHGAAGEAAGAVARAADEAGTGSSPARKANNAAREAGERRSGGLLERITRLDAKK